MRASIWSSAVMAACGVDPEAATPDAADPSMTFATGSAGGGGDVLAQIVTARFTS